MIPRLRLSSAFLCLAALVVTVALADEKAPPSPTPVQIDEVFAEWDGTQTPGCSLGVYRDGEIAYARGYGMANLEYGIANSPRTVFRIGSTSKQLTAMAVAVLAEAGELSLDDEVEKHFPEMPGYGEPVTIRHLIHHTSGVRDYLTLAELAEIGGEYSITEAVALIARQKELNFPPGEEYLYSNSNYFLLSQVVERVTGKTLREWSEENLFRRLGMKNTHFHDDHTHVVRNRADGHMPAEDGGFRLSMTSLDMVGDGGIFTTVEDLLLWDRNFYDNRLGKGGPELIETVETPAKLNDGADTGYAFGLMVGEHRGVRTIGHGGAFVGFRAAMDRYPDHELTVAVLCNLGTISPGPLARRVAELYLADVMEGEAETAAEPQAKVEGAALEDLERVTGSYWDESASRAREIVLREGKLFYSRGGFDSELAALGSDRFRMLETPMRVEVRFEPLGSKPESMTVEVAGQPPLVFERFERSNPSAAELEAYAGRFFSDELLSEQVLEVEDGVLVVRRRGDDIELKPLFADAFSGQGVMLRFERDAEGGVTALTINAGRVRNLRSVRR